MISCDYRENEAEERIDTQRRAEQGEHQRARRVGAGWKLAKEGKWGTSVIVSQQLKKKKKKKNQSPDHTVPGTVLP